VNHKAEFLFDHVQALPHLLADLAEKLELDGL
jgi:selenocysteine lyase/cysteine desulfurase